MCISRLTKEDVSSVLADWRASRGFDKGMIQVIHLLVIINV